MNKESKDSKGTAKKTKKKSKPHSPLPQLESVVVEVDLTTKKAKKTRSILVQKIHPKNTKDKVRSRLSSPAAPEVSKKLPVPELARMVDLTLPSKETKKH
ncbi:unnamed protein product [Meganyctiphanes norvegica]|uniref:Uncharacterized protein n=1 Tax=Meganyctiphanes norvegica TaxID=48144 RepID=A0AAV2RKS5_MEGNR